MTPAVLDLAALGADVEWPDAESAAQARSGDYAAAGRLGELVEWLAGTQGRFPPEPPAHPRCIVLGPVSAGAGALAESLDVGVREFATDDLDVSGACPAGSAVADDEVDAGTDLLIVADADSGPAAAVVVSLLTGAEPVALLPRGAAATDTASWIARATLLRDTRHEIARSGTDPGTVLAALGDPRLAATTGLVLRAVSRRTPVVLDGTGGVVAGLLAHGVQSRSVRWWRVADSSPDPVHARALAELAQQPLLDLATSSGDGTAGLLTVPLLRAAAGLGKQG